MHPQAVALVALVVATVALGLVWQSRQGRVRPQRVPGAGSDWPRRLRDLDLAPGNRATFVQFSAPVCAACRATARVLEPLAAGEPGVVHVQLDVEDHPDLARECRVLRVPTVVVLDADGAEVARASGAMTPAQARAALDVAMQDEVPDETVDEETEARRIA